MQILAVAGLVGVFALACLVIYMVGRSLQRRGRFPTFIDPGDPACLQGVPPQLDIAPPGRPYPHDDTSLFTDRAEDDLPRQKRRESP